MNHKTKTTTGLPCIGDIGSVKNKAIYWFRLVPLALACLLTSCATQPLITNLVKIHYRVLFNCHTVFPQSGEFYNPLRGTFVVYQITGIDNNDTQPLQFNFALNKIGVAGDPNAAPGNVAPTSLQFNTHFQASPGAVVAPGATGVSVGDFVIDVDGASITPGEQHAWHQLTYKSDPGEHVTFIREPALRGTTSVSSQAIQPNEVYWYQQMTTAQFKEMMSCNRGFGPPGNCVQQ